MEFEMNTNTKTNHVSFEVEMKREIAAVTIVEQQRLNAEKKQPMNVSQIKNFVKGYVWLVIVRCLKNATNAVIENHSPEPFLMKAKAWANPHGYQYIAGQVRNIRALSKYVDLAKNLFARNMGYEAYVAAVTAMDYAKAISNICGFRFEQDVEEMFREIYEAKAADLADFALRVVDGDYGDSLINIITAVDSLERAHEICPASAEVSDAAKEIVSVILKKVSTMNCSVNNTEEIHEFKQLCYRAENLVSGLKIGELGKINHVFDNAQNRIPQAGETFGELLGNVCQVA